MKDHPPLLTLNVAPPDEKNLFQVAELHGEMDQAGLLAVKAQLEQLVDNFPCRYLVFDCKDLAYINSDGIGFLMSLHAHLVKDGKGLVIVSTKPNVQDVLMAIGVLSVFEYHSSLEDFKKKLA